MNDKIKIVGESTHLLDLTAQIVTAYVARNTVDLPGITSVVQSVYSVLSGLQHGPQVAAVAPTPAVQIKKSITPDYLICLEDGKKLKMLKRHLRTSYGLTPEQYRSKWGLSPDYPMVAPNYTLRRSEFAKKIGLGKKTTRGRGGRRKAVPPVRAI